MQGPSGSSNSSARPLRIVIPGGSGQIGQSLARHFHGRGHKVTTIARRVEPRDWRTLAWNAIDSGPWTEALEGSDLVINLAGRSVNCRYSPDHRREILDSRIQTTRLIGQTIALLNHPPGVWMNASTATIYRHALDRAMDETTGELGGSEPGAPSTWRFSIEVARSWEQALSEARTPSTRKIALRSAMTMTPDKGGIFDTLLHLVRAGLGGTAGDGRQFVSWIHEADFIAAIEFLFERTEIEGPVNICSPNPVPNRPFMQILRTAAGIPIGLPATSLMLEIGAILLRTETELILKSRRVVPRRLLDAGFRFRFPDWPEAAADLLRHSHNTRG